VRGPEKIIISLNFLPSIKKKKDGDPALIIILYTNPKPKDSVPASKHLY
jgi:hypothetical protein